MAIILIALYAYGALLIFKGIRHSIREYGKAQWLAVPGKFNNQCGPMARRN